MQITQLLRTIKSRRKNQISSRHNLKLIIVMRGPSRYLIIYLTARLRVRWRRRRLIVWILALHLDQISKARKIKCRRLHLAGLTQLPTCLHRTTPNSPSSHPQPKPVQQSRQKRQLPPPPTPSPPTAQPWTRLPQKSSGWAVIIACITAVPAWRKCFRNNFFTSLSRRRISTRSGWSSRSCSWGGARLGIRILRMVLGSSWTPRRPHAKPKIRTPKPRQILLWKDSNKRVPAARRRPEKEHHKACHSRTRFGKQGIKVERRLLGNQVKGVRRCS